MPQPPEVDALGEPLRSAYANAWERIVAEQQAIADDPVREARRFRLAEVRARVEEQLDDLEKISSDWVANQFPKAYMLGGQAAAADAGGGGVGQFVWSQINEEAVQRLATGLYQDLLKATDGVRESTKELIRAISKDESLQALIEGRTAKQAGVEMRRLLEEKGISAVTYADKSRHGLREYSEMAQRTQTAIAYNEGSINQWAQSDVKYVEVFDGPTCGWTFHNDTTLASGLIVTLDEARAWPISHPNCRRGFGARPDIRTPKDARDAQGGQVTDSQMESQRAADRAQPGTKGQRYTQEQIARGQYEAPPHPNASAAEKQLANREAKLAERTAPVSQPMAAPQADYQIAHQAAGRDGSPLSDLTTGPDGGVYPEDVYDPKVQQQYYGTGEGHDAESFKVINAVRGKPDELVTVYRAVPDGVTVINQGDWVTISRSYADEHVVRHIEGGHVISQQVRAGDLFASGDEINEFGWAVDEALSVQPSGVYQAARFDGDAAMGAFWESDEGLRMLDPQFKLAANPNIVTGNRYLGEAARAQGFDGLPQVRTWEQLDELTLNPDTIVLYRGVGGDGSKLFQENLKNGEYFPGRGISGSGTYLTQQASNANLYTGADGIDNLTMFIVDPQARLTTYDALYAAQLAGEEAYIDALIDIEAKAKAAGETWVTNGMKVDPTQPMSDLQRQHRAVTLQQSLDTDLGFIAASRGFDGYSVGAAGDDLTYVIVNRTALILPPQEAALMLTTSPRTAEGLADWAKLDAPLSQPMMQGPVLGKGSADSLVLKMKPAEFAPPGTYDATRQAALDAFNSDELEVFVAHQRATTDIAMSSATGDIVKGSESTILKPDGTELHFSEFGSRMNEGEWYPGFGLRPDAATDYVMPRSWLIKQGDTVYMFEGNPNSPLSEQMKKAFQEQVDEHVKRMKPLPTSLTNNSKAVAFARGTNPQDVAFKKQFNIPHFVSESTACEGTITVWGGRTLGSDARLHELGHMADRLDTAGVRTSQSSAWAKAVESDRKTSQLFEGSETVSTATGHELLPGSDSVTVYGAVSPEEDFAESVRVFFQDKNAGFAGVAPDGETFRFADAWPERAKLLEAHFYGKPLSSYIPDAKGASYKEVVDHFGNLFDSIAHGDAGNYLNLPKMIAAGDTEEFLTIAGMPQYLNALVDSTTLNLQEVGNALYDSMKYWDYVPGKKPNGSMLFDFDDLIDSAEDQVSVLDEFLVLDEPVLPDLFNPPLGHFVGPLDEFADVSMMPGLQSELKAIYEHHLNTALKAGDKATVNDLLDKPENVQALTDHLSVYSAARVGEVEAYTSLNEWALEVKMQEEAFMFSIKAKNVPGGNGSIYETLTELVEDYAANPDNIPESLDLYKNALASKQGWVIQQQYDLAQVQQASALAVPKAVSKPSASLVGTTLEGLTEKQAGLFNLMQQWEDSGIDVEAMNHFQIMGKMSNQPALKGLKKVDALAAQNAHIAAKSGAQAQAALIDSLTPLQKLYLQISQDWKATQGYDSLDKSINSIMGKLHKYPEIKGIKKADVLAVHAAMAPGAHITAKVATTIEKATVDAAERAVRSTGEMGTWSTKSSTAAIMHLRRAGKKYADYPMPDGTGPLEPINQRMFASNREAQAKHQLVGSITTAMVDDEEVWEAFRLMEGTGRKTASGHVQTHPKVIGPMSDYSRKKRYELLYESNNDCIQQWAATSGNDHPYALAMQQAAKDEFGITGALQTRAERLGDPQKIKQMQEAIETAYSTSGPYYRQFLRAQYQHTQDLFAADGITHVSVYRGMTFSTINEPEWAGRYYGLEDEVAAAAPDPKIRTAADRQRLEAIPPAPRPLMLQPMNSWSTSTGTARGFGDIVFKMEIPVDRVVGSAHTGFGCLNEQEFVIFDSGGLAELYIYRGEKMIK